MHPGSLPEAIITRFRTLSLERIGRVESVWNALMQGAEDEEAVRAASRDLHTLKGDARIVGFDEVHVLSHKLEELFALAGQLQYRVSEDFELVVTMATQFVGMLLRKKSGGATGIDLDGFVNQVDDVLRETRALRRPKPTSPRSSRPNIQADELTSDRLSETTRFRIASAATHAFLEYLGARNQASRTRLRGIWHSLRDVLSTTQAMALAPLLARHVASSRELAAELGKQVEVDIAVGELRLESRVAEAIDLAIVHLMRNAIDHGIEAPAERTAAGKAAVGRLTVRASETAGQVEIQIADDGTGIDLHAVRTAAIARGMFGENHVASERELHDILFQPGFTTRSSATDVSGRGVGMDAVKAALTKVDGKVRLNSTRGAGTTVQIVVPGLARQLRVFQFLAPGNALKLAVSARWTPTVEDTGSPDAIDPVSALQLLIGSRQTITGTTQPPRDLAVKLRWGFLEIAIRAASEPALVTAERICPTDDESPVEVILIDGHEALLLRPEHVAELVRRGRGD